MGLFDNFLDKMKLSSDDDDYEDDDMMDEEEEVSSVRKSKRASRLEAQNEDIFEEKKEEPKYKAPVKKQVAHTAPKQSSNNKIVNMRRASNSNMEVCVIKPSNIEDGRDISDTLLDGKAVVLNLEGIDVTLAQRIIDFTSGACYSIRGNLQKISNYIFIATPETVDISGDFQELLASDFSIPTGSDF